MPRMRIYLYNGIGIPRVLFVVREVGVMRFVSCQEVYNAVVNHPDSDSEQLTMVLYPQYPISSADFYLAKRDTIGRLVHLRKQGKIKGGKPLKTWIKI